MARRIRTADRAGFAIALMLAAGAGCGTQSPTAPRTLVSITVTPNVSVPINGTQQFTALGLDAAGVPIPIEPLWSVVAGGGGIDGEGMFTAGTLPGLFTATVRAASGGVSGTVSVTVTVGGLAGIAVTPNPVLLAINGIQQFSAVGRDAGGNVLAVEPVWSVVAGGGAITAAGVFTAGSAGGTFPNTVRAVSGDWTGFATVTVSDDPVDGLPATITVSPNPVILEVDGTQQLIAVGRNAAGSVVAIAPAWSVVSGGGTITAGGRFTAGTVLGSYPTTVRAVSSGVSGYASVTIVSNDPVVGPLATISVIPNPVTLAFSGTQQYAAVGRDALGHVVAISPAWSVVAGGGTITAGGMFTAGTTAGNYSNTVKAISGGVSGFATVQVTSGPLTTITLSPTTISLAAGGTQQFTATGTDAGGNVVAISPTWSVVTGGGTITAGGLFTAGTTAGTFSNTVKAISGGVSGFASVQVTPGALATVSLSPTSTSLAASDTQQFTATGTDAHGNVVPVSPTWSVVAGGGTITPFGGKFTAGTTAGSFSNTVKAMSGGISGFATVEVTAGVLATITLSPNPITLAINGTSQYTAVGTDANGNVVAITPTWAVLGCSGTINSTGLYTAGSSTGSFLNTIRATSGGISGYATVDVAPGPLVSITVSPTTVSLAAGGTQQFTATGIDAGGNGATISPTWTVVSGGGTISSSGLFTAGATTGSYPNTVRATSGTIHGFAGVVVTSQPPLVDLGLAATHGALGNTSVTCTGIAFVGGDVGVAPGTSITGFPTCGLSGDFHPGDIYANLAHNSLVSAFNQLAALTCDANIAGDLGGLTLTPGVYCSGATQAITGEVFLDAQGDPDATFVIKSTTTLLTAAGSRVTLLNDAQAGNVYWLVGSSATLGASSFIKGNIVAFTTITVGGGVTLVGRALAAGATVTLAAASVITLP